MAFFIEFLKTAGVFDNFVKDCPLVYTSNNGLFCLSNGYRQ
jgi:hypothetical protein